MRTVIMPAAGYGSRFRTEGYMDPKPFIETGRSKTPMFIRAMSPFFEWGHELVPIVQGIETLRVQRICHEFEDNGLFYPIYLDHVQQGAALSILCAMGSIDDDSEVIVANSDQFFGAPLTQWFKYLQDNYGKLDGSILTFEAEGAAWSYAKTIDDVVVRVEEKKQISTHATCGVYYFRTWRILRNAICDMIADRHMVNNEFYLAPVYNYIKGRVTTFDASAFQYACVGTPELLKAWEATQEALYV